MKENTYAVEVQPDFIERQSKAQPIQALAELIWNGLDADATSVEVYFEYDSLGISKVAVYDNGHGIPYEDAPFLFTRLGGSWKRPGHPTKLLNRTLHGSEGRGRFKAFALGRVADWHVTYRDVDDKLYSYDITIIEDNIREVRISQKRKTETEKIGVIVTITELHRSSQSLDSDNAHQELTEIFALYLKNYKDVSITHEDKRIESIKAVASDITLDLAKIEYEGLTYDIALEIIEWNSITNRALYLCNEQGFPLSQVSTRFHIGPYQFSAYLKSLFISKLHNESLLDAAGLNPELNSAIESACDKIKEHFQSRSAVGAMNIVNKWKEDAIYPFMDDPETAIDKVERQVFDIVAVKISEHLPDFSGMPSRNKKFQLRMLRQAIERGPQELQLIINEVLDLSPRQRQEFAKVLQEVSLSGLISASSLITNRLKFIAGLEPLVFHDDIKTVLKERSQLHRLLTENAWLFGEEFNLSVSDQSLTEVLKKHRELLKDDIEIDRPVKHISKSRGIIDLMLSRTIRSHRPDELEHLIVELKAPKKKIGKDAINQIQEYAFSVVRDERFKHLKVKWHFWAVSSDLDSFAEDLIVDERGTVYEKNNIVIRIKLWSQIIADNKARLQFFQENLLYQADHASGLKYLRETYSRILSDKDIQSAIKRSTSDLAVGYPATTG